MNSTISQALSGFKYLYIIAFFTLLSGVFHPLITNSSFDGVVGGVLVLFVGLFGGMAMYKAATDKQNRGILMGVGFVLMTISLLGIIYLTGRAGW